MSPPPVRIRAPLNAAAVRLRRLLVRRPWIHWALVVAAGTGAAATALDHADRVDAARRSWGETATVHVAATTLEAGDPVRTTATEIPSALVGDHVARASELDGAVARQRIAAGEIVSSVDVVPRPGPTALIPDGWLGVPVVESPASGADLGARVVVVSDGFVLGQRAIVVGRTDDVTLIAVPAEVAPLLPAAAQGGNLTLLLVP